MSVFPDDLEPDEHGLVAVGGILTPELLTEAYSKGIFPWTGRHPIPWFSPDPRMILLPPDVHVSRSLAKVIRREQFDIRFDTSFRTVMQRCATISRAHEDGTWITPNMLSSYGDLHDLGVAHCAEAWLDGELVGGLYGVGIGRIFFGESMFADVPNASKVAFVALCRRLAKSDYALIDCQQETAHLTRLGGFPISRAQFIARLREAVAAPDAWSLE